MSVSDPLLEKAQAGDPAAFGELLGPHQERIRRVVIRLLGGGPDVEDVVQDVLVQVYRSLGTFRAEAKFTTWLYRLTLNVTKMHLRRLMSRPRFGDQPVPERPSAYPDPGPTGIGQPDDNLDRNRRVQALHALVSRLSEKKRTVLVLHDFEGVKPKDIADIVGAPVMTVRTRLFYARKELYAAIAADPVLAPAVPPHPASEAPEPRRSGSAVSQSHRARGSEPGAQRQ